MPVHQQKTSNGQATKPLMPALSSRFRSTKSPMTPKLAGSPQTSPILAHLSPERDVRPNIASIAREDNSPLGTNVTPRSGNRRSRIGTDSPATPTGITSTGARRTRAMSGSKTNGTPVVLNGTGLGIASPGLRPYTAGRVLQNNANSVSTPNLSRRISIAKSGMGSEDSSATSPFFHADDAKSSISSYDVTERSNPGPKVTPFFYVGGGNITASPDPARPKTAGSGSPHPDASKFFHANDLPEPSPRVQSTRPQLSKKNSSASIGSPRLQSPDLQRKLKNPSRPPSPLKEISYRSAPPALQSPLKTKPIATPVLTARLDAARRTSISSNASTPRQVLHKKASSTNVLPNGSIFKSPALPMSKPVPQPDLQAGPKSPQRQRLSREIVIPSPASPRSISLVSDTTHPTPTVIHLPSEAPVSASPVLSSSNPIEILKPPEITRPPPTPAQEAATNARRERKVLDLEISNSSLLAINRTLERELRKQTAELRRFRRLSRSGRLSIRTVSDQSKSSLGVLAEDGDEDFDADAHALLKGLDAMDLGDSDDDEPSASSDSDANSATSRTASESASNLSSTHALAQRRRDEKRLMLDLSKHRQLLIDSEKMNASIRRCVAWSEEMIKDGQKALEHRVRVGDVKLGGRVLERDDSDEDEDAGGRRMGLVSPSRVLGTMEAERLWKDARDEAMSPLPVVASVGGLTDEPEHFDDLL